VKALVGAGGGPKGAWSAGALKACNEYGLLHDVARGYGNSVNAINIPYLCQEEFSPRSFENIKELWMKVVDKDVFKNWLVPYLPALWQGGLASIDPLRKFLEPYIRHEKALTSRVPAYVSAWNLNKKRMEFGCSRSGNFVKWILASAAHPIWFEPVQIENCWYTDGGVVDVTPVKQAIKDGCNELLVFLHTPVEAEDTEWGEKDSEGEFFRPGIIARTFQEFEVAMDARLDDDLGYVEAINKAVLAGVEGFENKRYISMTVFRPKKALNVDMPHFRPEDSKRLFEDGYRETAETLQMRST